MVVFLLCCWIMLASLPADHLTPFLKCNSAHLGAWRWGSTKACEQALQYRVGERIHGFTVSQVGLGGPPVSAQSRGVVGGHVHLCPQPQLPSVSQQVLKGAEFASERVSWLSDESRPPNSFPECLRPHFFAEVREQINTVLFLHCWWPVLRLKAPHLLRSSSYHQQSLLQSWAKCLWFWAIWVSGLYKRDCVGL